MSILIRAERIVTAADDYVAAAERLEALATLPDQRIASYGLLVASKNVLEVGDETLFRAMEVAAESGALVMVHAGTGDANDVLVREALARGDAGPINHELTR